jgi:uncharacterized protein (DUF983 family)
VLLCADMNSGEGIKATPQFETAEFQNKAGANACFVCHQPISGSYYRINSRMACAACTERLRISVPKDSHAAFVRATLFGVGAAIVGLALYALVGITTGLAIGYVSLAVGWMVGTAMMKGSGGLGGRRYQIVALLLTYAAVSLAAIPIAISQFNKTKNATQAQIQQSTPQNEVEEQPPQTGASDGQSGAVSETGSRGSRPSTASVIGYMAMLGLASPFLELASDPFHGLIGLIILLIGVRIARRLTRGRPALAIEGPF